MNQNVTHRCGRWPVAILFLIASELVLVQLPELSQSGYPWMEVRDVIEVDGKAVPDRQERLDAIIRTEPNWRWTVTYRRHPTLRLRLPSEMVEKATAEEGHT